LEGVNDARAESKIRGMTLQGAYCDELTLFTEDFFAMLLSRLSVAGAKLFATTNPDNPHHWVKVKYMDRQDELDMLILKFLIDDNLFLDPEYVENLKKEYTGVFYDRFIRGLWISAEGVIYRKFADNPEPFIIDEVPPVIFSTIGIDFGGTGSAQAFNCTGFTKGLHDVITLDEYYTKDPIDPDVLNKAVVDFVRAQIAKGYPVREIYADSAEQVLIRGIRNALAKAGIGIQVSNAIKGEINDRIRFYCLLMGAGRYKVMWHCVHTIDAFSSAVWDSKQLEDVRLDDGTTNIDSLDSQEYSTEKLQKQIIDLMMLGR
jgi:PBSX family phage terminase large subunit